jgi:Domain of unknown function (DUF4157)
MRWLPRRRRGEHRDAPPSPGSAAERTQAPEQSPTEPTTRRTAARSAGAAHWRRLPPLAATMHRAPLTATATLGALAQEPTRPLLHPASLGRPLSRRRRDESMPVDAAADEGVAVEPAVGRVTGLATVLAEAPTEPDAPAPSPAPAHRRVPVSPISEPPAAAEPPPSAPRLTPRVVPSAGPRPNLLRAEGEYVGAPEPDAAPYASSAWLRMVESYRPPWANDPAAGAPSALPPIPEGGASWSSEAALPPPRPPKAARREGPGPQRRASLAESRRLGLGKPLRPSPPGESGPESSPESSPESDPGSSPQESDSQDTQTATDPPADSPASPIEPTELRHGRPERTEAPATTSPPETDGESDSQDTRTATDPPTGSPASPIGPTELRHSRPERGEAPAATSPPETDRDAGTYTGTIGAVADDEPRPRPRPRLGLGAPIDRPVRSSRDASPNVPPAPPPPPRARSAPTPPDPVPSPPPVRATDEASVPGTVADSTEPARPTPRRRAEPVYRFVPAERPARTATSPRPAMPQAAPPSPPTAAAVPAPPAAAPAVRPSAPTAPSARPLTHPRAQRRSDADRAEAEPRPPRPAPPPPQQGQTTVPDPIPERVQGVLQQPVHQVPAELLDAVRWAQGVDVSDVPIRRDPEVADEARTLGARSFTRDAEVFLPPEHGSPQEPVARGLLAHELTHAAQQRALGSALPPEDSEAGRALEAQAVAAERWARGLSAPPAPAAHGGPATAPLGASWTAPWQAAPTRGVQRQTEDVAGLPEAADGSDPSEQPGAATPPPAGTRVDHEMASARDRLLDLSRRRPLDLDDPDDIDELSVRIYQRIHRRLRRELLVERERAGQLGESGPFGAAR